VSGVIRDHSICESGAKESSLVVIFHAIKKDFGVENLASVILLEML